MTLGPVHSPTPAASIKHSRRGFVRGALAGAAAVALADQMFTRTASAQTALTLDAAVQQLIDGNRRFAEGRMTSFDEELSILKAKTVDKQEPFAAALLRHSPVLAEQIKQSQLKILAAYYDLASGKVTILD